MHIDVPEKPSRRLWIASSLLFLAVVSITFATSAYKSITSPSTEANLIAGPWIADNDTLVVWSSGDTTAASAGVRRGGGEQKRVKARGCWDGICLDVVSLARSKGLKAGETLPLVFTDSGYWPVLFNSFVAQARVSRNLPAEVGVVCLDDAVVELLRSVGAPPCLRLSKGSEGASGEKKSGDKKVTSPAMDDVGDDVSDVIKGDVLKSEGHSDHMRDLWALRVLELRQLLRAGYGALFFDVDAVWQADLRDARYLGTHPAGTGSDDEKISKNGSSSVSSSRIAHAYDVVASRGSFPNDVGNVWGATLCMGLVYFAPTPGGKAVVSRLAARILPGQPFDDQMALNRALLHDAELTWLKSTVNSTETAASPVGSTSGTILEVKTPEFTPRDEASVRQKVDLNREVAATRMEKGSLASMFENLIPSKQTEGGVVSKSLPSQTSAAKAAAALASRKAEALKNSTLLVKQHQRHRRGFRRPSSRQRRLSWRGNSQIKRKWVHESAAHLNHLKDILPGRSKATSRTPGDASSGADLTERQWHEGYQGRHMRRQLRNRRPLWRASKGISSGGFLQYTSSKDLDVGVGKINGTEVRVALLAHSTVPRRCEQKVGMGTKQLRRAAALHCFAHKVRLL